VPNITFEQFRELARRDGLDPNERIDDPLDTRAGKIDAITADIRAKLPRLDDRARLVVDIGPGCGAMPAALAAHCERHEHLLWLVDSPEMLAHTADMPHITKVPGKFPEVFDRLRPLVGGVDAVLAYSMLHYVFEHDNVWEFLDRALALLAPGGRLLLGDVPSRSKRKRMATARHGQSSPPLEARAGEVWPGGLTDGVLFGLMAFATESGFDAYLLPQPPELPMAERRIDLLFERPG
jgi:cyclopropane fatty-acyl-phospholipid synthase-like methyltransferase